MPPGLNRIPGHKPGERERGMSRNVWYALVQCVLDRIKSREARADQFMRWWERTQRAERARDAAFKSAFTRAYESLRISRTGDMLMRAGYPVPYMVNGWREYVPEWGWVNVGLIGHEKYGPRVYWREGV